VANEWIPVIGAAIGATAAVIVGVTGIVFTWLTGKQAREQAELVADKRLEHERTMAHEARRQERRGNAYVRLLTVVETTGQWAQMVKPMLDSDPPQEVLLGQLLTQPNDHLLGVSIDRVRAVMRPPRPRLKADGPSRSKRLTSCCTQ